MGRISALTEVTELASNDYLLVLDSSANIAKKVSVANAFGIPTFGWTASGESWTYASWSSGTRTGTITVPTDATTKYKVGDRIKITQSTGGTKYGIITKVEATLITVFFPSGTTLNNEAIVSPSYALAGLNPLGFPTDPTLWYLETTSSSNVSQSSPTSGTWYNLGSLNLVVPVGAWDLEYEVNLYATYGSGPQSPFVTLSTANNSESSIRWSARVYVGSSSSGILGHVKRNHPIMLTSSQTYYLNSKTDVAGTSQITFWGSQSMTVIRAKCSLL